MSPRYDPRLALAARWANDPHAPGRRTVLAKTCPLCGLLLPAHRFQRYDTGRMAGTCMRCKQAKRMGRPEIRAAADRARFAAAASRNAVSRGGATRHGYVWTSVELEIATRPTLTASEAASMLGRTVSAVRNVRIRAIADPRYIDRARR